MDTLIITKFELQLGMRKMFLEEAELSEMLNSKENLTVSAVLHKEFIDIDEIGV